MCTVLEEDFILEEPNLDGKSETQICKKCKSSDATVVLRRIDVYCKDCFLAASTHKFRAMLGKYRVIKPNDKVLVVYQLGEASSALLHMIRTGLGLSQHKRLRFVPEYLFIDEFFNLPKDEHMDLLKIIQNQVSAFNFNLFFTSLHTFMKNKDETPKYYNFEDYINNFEENMKLNTQKNVTNEQDMFEICKRNLIVNIAIQLDCPVVLTPEISVDTAVGILSNIALGRGSHISLNVGILDDRDPKIKIFTPLRLFEINELEYYNKFNNLETIDIKNNNSPYDSVQNLMKKFVEDLQINYPSTIKTVTRTGDKLTCIKNENVCEICKAPIGKQENLSSSEATEFSKVVSLEKVINVEKYEVPMNTEKYCFACSKLQKYFI